MPAEKEHMAREFLERMCEEVWGRGNLDVIDDLFAPACVVHDHHTPPGGEQRSPERLKSSAAKFREAFPDLHVDIGAIVVSSEGVEARISYHYRLTATHLGRLHAIAPTGRQVNITGMSMMRLAGDRIVESWESSDTLTMMRQLDLIVPKPQKAPGLFSRPAPPRPSRRSSLSNGNGWNDLAMLAAFLLGWSIGDD
ncbi:MAG TPA: ester cyclase [Rubrobacteraceae bacterium]|nr:ester cyclase [Rubrobacteraceae bacterium]